jgi:hypothetical protein
MNSMTLSIGWGRVETLLSITSRRSFVSLFTKGFIFALVSCIESMCICVAETGLIEEISHSVVIFSKVLIESGDLI